VMLLLMLRHVARLAPVPVAMAGSVAVSAMTAVALSLFHPLDATMMILAWNVGLTVILLIGSAWYGPRLFHWIEPRS
ncbi:NrsF family protein, partial [Burkholderia cenocepacia]